MKAEEKLRRQSWERTSDSKVWLEKSVLLISAFTQCFQMLQITIMSASFFCRDQDFSCCSRSMAI